MFGFFLFAQPLFADVPVFGATGGGGGGGDGPRNRWKKKLNPRDFEARLEISLITFLNTQE